MTGQCFNCKEDITNHDSQKMIECLTALSKKTESLQKNLESNKHRDISDFISGMTDRYAINLYNNLK